MGKKGGKTYYYLYYFSQHLGFCHGPIDSIEQIYFREKKVWTEDDEGPQNAPGTREINKPELFGGDEREGGIVGTLQFAFGTLTQKMFPEMASRINRTPDTAPGYRGLASIMLHGSSRSDRPGAAVSANQPNVPNMWARIRRLSKTLGGNTLAIPFDMEIDKKTVTWVDANPAHMIHETVLSSAWGMGGVADDLDTDSFTHAASVLHEEKFGLSMVWKRQSTVESFIREIIDHINALFFFNPFTGKGVLKLLRDDYDVDTLQQYGPDNCQLLNFRRKLWGETVNEITVTYTVPETEQPDSVSYQDPGNVALQGEIISETRNYYGIRNKELALEVCARDVQSAAAPLATAEIRVLRTQWKELPGDCIKFEWPQHGIENVIFRVMDIDWGTVSDASITVSLVEDIFGLARAEFSAPIGPGEWEDPDEDPNSSSYGELPTKFFAAPYSLIQQDLPSEYHDDVLNDDNYPRIVIGAAVSPRPPTYDENGELKRGQEDFQSFRMLVPAVTTNGEAAWDDLGERTLTGRASLAGAMQQEVVSEVLFANKYGGDGPAVGRYGIVGEGAENVAEWIMFDADLGNGNWRVIRGVMDTVPQFWGNGTTVRFISEGWYGYDTGESFADEIELYKLQPRTSKGLRKLELVPTSTTVRPDRPYLPYRPANVVVESVMFGKVDETQVGPLPSTSDDEHEPRRFLLAVSWSNRNRTMEDAVVRRWDDGDITPEPGQTTEIIVYAGTAEVGRITGLTGTTHEFDLIATTYQFERLKLKFVSRRDGFESLQGITLDLALYIKGYGSDFGMLYGGWPHSTEGVLTAVNESDLMLPGLTAEGEIYIRPFSGIRVYSKSKPWYSRPGWPWPTVPLMNMPGLTAAGELDNEEDE